MRVTTTIQFEDMEENYSSSSETLTFSNEVGDLDIESWLWYSLRATELAGFDVKDLNLTTKSGKFYTTDI